jgi:hypothetical protein
MTQKLSLFKTVLIKNIFEKNGLPFSERGLKLITFSAVPIAQRPTFASCFCKRHYHKKHIFVSKKSLLQKKVDAFFAFCSGKCRNVWFSLLILVLWGPGEDGPDQKSFPPGL